MSVVAVLGSPRRDGNSATEKRKQPRIRKLTGKNLSADPRSENSSA